MKAEYTNTQGDAIAFHLWVSLHTWQYALVWAFCAAILLIPLLDAAPTADVPAAVKIVGVVVLDGIALFAVFALAMAMTVLFVCLAKDRGVYTTHTLTADEHGLTEETPVNRSTFSWEGVERIARTRRHIFIFVGPLKAHVIPRRDVTDAAEWDAMYQSLMQWHAALRA